MEKLLYLIQLPPPIHGVTCVNKVVYNSERINKGIKKKLVKISYSDSLKDLNKITPSKLLRLFLLYCRVIKELILFKPTALYTTTPPTGFGFFKDVPIILLCKIANVHVIFHFHGIGIKEELEKPFREYLYKVVLNNSSIIHLSEGLIKREFNDIDLRGVNYFPVPNGVSNTIRTSNGQKNGNNKTLLFLSNLISTKGIWVLIESFSLVLKKHPNAILKIVGEATNKDIEKDLQERINQLEIEKNVKILGPKFGTEKDQIFQSSDVFIHPTLRDAFPLVILEAMRAGIPVVSTNVGAISEIVDDGVTGFVVESGNPKMLANKIIQLLNNETISSQFGTNAKKKYESIYTIEKFEMTLAQAFRQILFR